MKKIKVMTWNNNQRSGITSSEIKQIVIDEIFKQNPDVCVLTEYVKAQNQNNFVDRLAGAGYYVLSDPRYVKGINEVFIAFKNNLLADGEEPQVCTFPVDENNPNFLAAKLNFRGKTLNIIGTRIRIAGGNSQEALNQDFKERKTQFDVLKRYLNSLEGTTILAGDFNNGYYSGSDTVSSYEGKARQYYSYPLLKQEARSLGYYVYTPEGHSWEDFRGGKYQLDHIIAKGCEVSNLKYDWSFTANPHYCHNTIGYPDHAILTASIFVA